MSIYFTGSIGVPRHVGKYLIVKSRGGIDEVSEIGNEDAGYVVLADSTKA